MMADYIRREDARRMVVQLDKYVWASPVSDEIRHTVDADLVKFGLDRIPAADVVEVVRCKDCKYGDYDSKPDGAMVCLRTNDGFWRQETDFCSYGERKDGGGSGVSD